MEEQPVFYIEHIPSSKYIHPLGGTANNGTKLVIHRGGLGQRRLQYRFIKVEGEGHFGYFETVETEKKVHPACSTDAPHNGTRLNFHSATHCGALFAYDSKNHAIQHISGKYWHPATGENNDPNDGTEILLWDGVHQGTRFQTVDSSGKEISPYPKPELAGQWRMINCIIDPAATYEYILSYTIGKSHTKSSTTHHEWSVSAGVSTEWFSSSVEYSGYVEKTTEDTWYESKTAERKIIVTPGRTIVTWQWTFSAHQYGDSLQFESNIVTDTYSLKEPPKLEDLR